ncbi:MAG: PilT/PilU family type 4a pilus ATPase [Candidatus Vogelbacteria bacterium]|nr:PilT/PilU family type 4a pilus ATPase [Candidatus Vogelbacteria bacterium]
MDSISRLLSITVKENASDLHLVVGRHPTIRTVGELLPLVNEPVLTADDTRKMAEMMLEPEMFKQLEKDRELDFSYTLKIDNEHAARFRCNAFFARGAISIALRHIPAHIRTFADLGLPDTLEEFCYSPQGFFLVVGPVGQGKSTTLAAMVELINANRARHILTIEDPIEYLFESKRSIVNQREVRFDTATFANALRGMFREDINVAMIGEMRGPETISTAVTAAETGHLILSTLHTNNAAQTVDRIIDSFPAAQQNQIRVQLAGALLGIFSQRLLPRTSGGLIPAYELMRNTTAVSNLIREGRTAELGVLIETGSRDGMIDLNRSLVELVERGEISAEEARKRAFDPKALDRLL